MASDCTTENFIPAQLDEPMRQRLLNEAPLGSLSSSQQPDTSRAHLLQGKNPRLVRRRLQF